MSGIIRCGFQWFTIVSFTRTKGSRSPQNKSKIKTVDRYHFGKTIKAARLDVGMTRRQVAELLQIIDKTLIAYENGERLVHVDNLGGLAQIYETSIDSII